ncbi:MAG: RNA polymerase sigma factor [Phycisphaerales bacterium JB041]
MSTSEPLLDRVAAGGEQSAEALLDRYGGLVWSLARRFCRDRAEAEDAVQEIMVEVWKSVRQGRYDASKGSETTFVATIARRRLIDRLRRRRLKTSELAMDVASPKPQQTDSGELTEESRAASEVLERLSEAQQTAIRMAVLHGLTHEEVAQATGMPLGTVKTHIRRGLIKMREMLAAAGPQPGAAGKGALS